MMGSLPATTHPPAAGRPLETFPAPPETTTASASRPGRHGRNPYTPGEPITDATMFFGREAELGLLLARLAAGEHTAVVGPSAIGISSLLRRVGALPQAQDLLVATVDLADARFRTPEGLAQGLWAGWWSQVRPGYVPAIGELTVLGTLAGRLAAAGHRLVAVLDGYEQLVWRPRSFGRSFWAELDTLVRNGPITWVVGTHRPLVDLHQQAEIESGLYEAFVQQDIGLLDAAGALALLSRPMERSGLAWPAAEAAELVELAGPHPFFLQLAGSIAYETVVAGAADRARIAQQFRAAAEPYWRELWLSLPPTARATLALDKAPADAAFTARQVRSLGRKGLVVGEGRDARLFSGGFAEWARAMQRATQLAREAAAEPRSA